MIKVGKKLSQFFLSLILQDKNLENSEYVPGLAAPNSPPDKEIQRERAAV